MLQYIFNVNVFLFVVTTCANAMLQFLFFNVCILMLKYFYRRTLVLNVCMCFLSGILPKQFSTYAVSAALVLYFVGNCNNKTRVQFLSLNAVQIFIFTPRKRLIKWQKQNSQKQHLLGKGQNTHSYNKYQQQHYYTLLSTIFAHT